MLRGAGLNWDIRKSEPYSSYEKFDFKVPVETTNDVWSRYRVRLQEMRESAKIITQALEGMPDGPWQADAPHVVLPDREKMKTQMEALIYHFKIVTEGFRVPAGEVYQCVEAPRGEIGYYIVSDGTSKPYRVHMRTPSFGNLQGLPKMLENTLIADSIAAMGGALLGTSTVTSYIESAAGVKAGGRTGLTGVTVAALFLLTLFFAPLAGSVPAYATAPALLFVACLMARGFAELDWDDVTEYAPAVVTALAMPLTFSIANGIAFGFITYAAVKLLSGRFAEAGPSMLALAALFVVKYAFF
jgi:hypothetical protein